MARPLRIEAAGAWYHVTARGNERRPIFRGDADRVHFLELIGELAERFRVVVAAYVLLDNHYHLLVQPQERNLSRAMQWLGVSYTVWFNRRHRRVGHLFQGRFASVVLEDGAVAEVSRYVHLNPVRVRALGLDKAAQARSRVGLASAPDRAQLAERVRRLREYRWSSYRAAVGLTPAPDWLAVDAVLELMGGRNRRDRQQRYREYVEGALRDGLPESPWERLEAQVVLGGEEFVARMRQWLTGNEREQPALRRLRARPAWETIVQAVVSERGAPWAEFRDQYGDWGRDAALYLGRAQCGLKLQELGDLVGGLDYRSVSWAIQRVVRRRRNDQEFAARLRRLESQIQNPEM